ncbi:hypothetical protein LINGRAPRIM_LOCUS740 [Linum grandiflorum]
MPKSEVMVLLGLTRRREPGCVRRCSSTWPVGMREMVTCKRQVQSDTQSVGISTTSTWTGIVPSAVGG